MWRIVGGVDTFFVVWYTKYDYFSIVCRYFMQFEARMGMRIFSDVAIDDFSLSPECFGLNIPVEALQGYNYYEPKLFDNRPSHHDFVNRSGE